LTIPDYTIVKQFETDDWAYTISEYENRIEIRVAGKHDHRDREIRYSQSRRLFPELMLEDNSE
jgi:hypothetical protein